MSKNIFVACDTTNLSKVRKIIRYTQSKKLKIGYKFGLEFFYSKSGRSFLSKMDKKQTIFLDLKLNDIPNTCVSAINSLKDLKNIKYLTVHINGGYEMLKTIKKSAKKNKSKIKIFNDPKKAISNSDVVFADKFISIYDKKNKNKKKKIKNFKNFQVNSKLMSCAKKNAIFLHCLPASRGQEVSAEVLDGKQSKVWQQALNRLHVQKSILLYCLERLR